MTAEEREKLHDLHRAARDAWAASTSDGKRWADAFDADSAFFEALYAIKLSKETP